MSAARGARGATAALAWLALTGLAWAHGFHLELRVEGEELIGEAYFSDGGPPSAGQWAVYRDGASSPLAEGPLSPAGSFRYRPSGPGRYRFEVREPGLHLASAEHVVAATPPERAAAAGSSPAAVPQPAAARRAASWTRTRLKRVLTGLGAIAVLAVGLARWQRRRRVPGDADDNDDDDDDDPQGGQAAEVSR